MYVGFMCMNIFQFQQDATGWIPFSGEVSNEKMLLSTVQDRRKGMAGNIHSAFLSV